jgi:serine/threonine protein phosphatase PrpC
VFVKLMPSSYVHASAFASCRRNSEDRGAVLEHARGLVVVVADGAGGMRGGGTASDALVGAVQSVLETSEWDASASAWARILETTDQNLAACLAGETTGVAVALTAAGLVGISAGDSEAWVVDGTSIDDLTSGQKKHRLGSGRAVPTPFHRPRLEGTLVVATDGLFRYATADRIAAVVNRSPFADVARVLTELVRLSSGSFQDDVGVVIVRRRRERGGGRRRVPTPLEPGEVREHLRLVAPCSRASAFRSPSSRCRGSRSAGPGGSL